jgi:hypothetical protein
MYLGRWISFYMDINDVGAKGRCKSSSINQCYADTKEEAKMFEDETHSEEIPSECVWCKSISPSCKVRGQPKPPVRKVCGQLETTWCDGS